MCGRKNQAARAGVGEQRANQDDKNGNTGWYTWVETA
jgi:hypothetical protein